MYHIHTLRQQENPRTLSENSPDIFIFDSHDRLHLPMSLFAAEAKAILSHSTINTYLHAIMPFFDYLDRVREIPWDDDSEIIRGAIEQYLMSRLLCMLKTRLDDDTDEKFQVVETTTKSSDQIRAFLCALKKFYQIAIQLGLCQENPLSRSVSTIAREFESHYKAEWDYPQMPQISGVAHTPSYTNNKRRLTDNYFVLDKSEWIPQTIDNPEFPGLILNAGECLGWSKTAKCIARLLFETGARISEITGLTLGDYENRSDLREMSAFNKGSKGRRVKFLRCSNNTAKLLLELFDTERLERDPRRYRLEDYRRLAKHRNIDLFKIPLFLNNHGRALTARTFREHYWHRACDFAGIKAQIHQTRHWYVTSTMKTIYDGPKEEIEKKIDRLIRYIHWESKDTIKAYDHFFATIQHAEMQDVIHEKIQIAVEKNLQERLSGNKPSLGNLAPTIATSTQQHTDVDETDGDTIFAELQRFGGHR